MAADLWIDCCPSIGVDAPSQVPQITDGVIFTFEYCVRAGEEVARHASDRRRIREEQLQPDFGVSWQVVILIVENAKSQGIPGVVGKPTRASQDVNGRPVRPIHGT